MELCYKALLLSSGIKPEETHKLAILHTQLIKVMPDAVENIEIERINELDKFGDIRGGIRYPESFPSEWQHTRSIWEDLEPFKDYALKQTYKHGSEFN